MVSLSAVGINDQGITDVESERHAIYLNVVTFGNANLHFNQSNKFIRPPVDDGFPYSGMGAIGFIVLQSVILPDWNGKLDPLAENIADRPFWQ